MLNHKKEKIIETIKILIYKENKELFEKLDYDRDEIYTKPLLFAYFNSRRKEEVSSQLLFEILQGFLDVEKLRLNLSYNKDNISYIPDKGYYKKGSNKQYLTILKYKDFEIIKELPDLLNNYFVEFYKGHIIN
ncbi:hypothetical protein [Tenacibaculum dicentrarchi]